MEHDFSMNKLDLRQTILDSLEQKWRVAQSSMQRAVESATDEETVPEHKYDTLALEASYLAHGQSVRVQECEREIRMFRELELSNSPQHVVLGSLVAVVDMSDRTQYFFVAPCAGGLKVELDGTEVLVVTFQSPLGQALKGKSVGDELEYQVSSTTFSYEIETIS